MDEISLRRKKKKIIIVCFAIFAAVASISCAFFIFNRFVYQEKIAFNGALYTKKGENITELRTAVPNQVISAAFHTCQLPTQTRISPLSILMRNMPGV